MEYSKKTLNRAKICSSPLEPSLPIDPNLRDILDDVLSPPSVVLDRLSSHLYHTHVVLDAPLSALHGRSESSALGLLEVSGGLAQMGDWPLPANRAKGKMRHWPSGTRLLLHWPTLIRNADELAFNNPVMAVFFLSFWKIIHQRSPFVLEALKRRYKFEAQKVENLLNPPGESKTKVDEDPPGESKTKVAKDPPILLHPAEMRSLKGHLAMLSKDRDFISVLQYSSAQAYCGIKGKTERYSLRADRRPVDPAISSKCSRIYIADTDRCSDSVEIHRPRSLTDPNLYCCANLNWMLEELWVAYHLAHPGMTPNKKYGSEIVSGLGLAVVNDHLFIRWESWLNYRDSAQKKKAYPKEVLRGLSPRAKRSRKGLGYVDGVLRSMDDAIRRRYKRLSVPFAPVAAVAGPGFEAKLVELWGSTEPTVVSVIDLKALESLSILRQKLSGRGKDPEAAVRASPPSPLEHSITLYYPDGSTQDLQIHHNGLRLLVLPFWDMVGSKRYNDKSSLDLYGAKNLKAGVFYVSSKNQLGYTPSFLLDPLKSSQTPHEVDFPHLVSTLKMLKGLSRKELKLLINLPDPYSAAVKWSYAEDTLIKVLYRPNMSVEDQRRLMEGCPGRRPNAISTRSKYLCEQLIAKGVYDIQDLPHKNCNPNLLAKIRKAKKGGSPK